MQDFTFKNFYIDGYEGSIDDIYYEGKHCTIVITHTFNNEDGVTISTLLRQLGHFFKVVCSST